jgi:hypothetical protein
VVQNGQYHISWAEKKVTVLILELMEAGLGVVAQVYNPSYWGGRHHKDQDPDQLDPKAHETLSQPIKTGHGVIHL